MNSVKPISTALCSFGMSGRLFHAPFLMLSPFYNVTAVLERTKNESGELLPDAKIYRNLQDMLKDDSIELVIVNTPNSTHFDFAAQALEAGKHVVVEKPFTVTAGEGIQLIRLAEKHNRVLSGYQNRRYDSDYKTVLKVLKSGKLGDIVEAEMHFDRYRLEPGNKSHKEIPGPGTGNLYDLGSHLLDQAIQLFGMPQKIFADIDIIRKESRVDDYFELILFYDNLRVRLHSSYLALGKLPGYIFYGTTGTFMKAKTNNQEERLAMGELPGNEGWGSESLDEYGTLKWIEDGKEQEEVIPSEQGNYQEYYDLLYDSVRYGRKAPVPAADSVQVIHLIELAYKSNELKKVVVVNDLFKR